MKNVYEMFTKKMGNIFKSNLRNRVQRMGSFMAGMILPAISAFIAWGLWSSMFLYNSPTSHGWFQVPALGQLVGPGIKWLLPILVGINAGRLIYGLRGSVFAAFIVVAIIVGTDAVWNDPQYADIIAINGRSLAGRAPNQIIGALIIAPLATWAFKNVEKLYINRIRQGFEMLIKNFSSALIAIAFGLVLFYAWAWIMFGITFVLTAIINGFGTNKFVAPLLTIFTEPTRTIFLNNALNHGVLSPIGLLQVQDLQQNNVEFARSFFFLYGGNAGPGFGLLMSYVIWKKGTERTNAAGASLIQFVGGIHEVYYVYVLASPIMLLATIPGAMGSMFIFSYLDGGTSTIVSPGSIISVISTSPNGYSLGINILGVLTGALVSFGISSLIMRFQRKRAKATNQVSVTFSDEGIQFNNNPQAQPQLAGAGAAPIPTQGIENPPASKGNALHTQDGKEYDFSKMKNLYVVCDAGVGSSAMGATLLKKFVVANKLDINVDNFSIKSIPQDADIIVTTNVFVPLVKEKNPHAYVYGVKFFLKNDEYKELHKILLENFKAKDAK